jgi:hypothetical protein
VKANCWSLAEAAGYESPYRMQALLGSYRWDWRELRAELPGLVRAWLPCDPGDLIGPGLAFDETAQLKDGDATACVAPQHAGCLTTLRTDEAAALPITAGCAVLQLHRYYGRLRRPPGQQSTSRGHRL